MSNTIQIKRGQGIPADGQLTAYELGFITDSSQLVIGIPANGTIQASGIRVSEAQIAQGAKTIVNNTGALETVGSSTRPIFLLDGKFQQCSSDAAMSGTIEAAEKLAKSVKIQVNLELNDAASFDGSKDITTSVTGVLPITKGGTGVRSMDELLSTLLQNIYPIGSIYMSVNNTSPADLFGGTWVQLKDRFLLGAGDNYTAGGTGGEATHILTQEELPSFTVSVPCRINSTSGGSGAFDYSSVWQEEKTHSITAGGNGEAHNNMPPYLVVYMWKRTA